MKSPRRFHRKAVTLQNMDLRKRLRHARLQTQRGFTLLEVVAVVAFVGILAWIFAPKLLGSTDNAKALAYRDMAQSLANNFRINNQSCGTANTIAASALPTTPGPDGVLQLLVDGSNINPTYSACFNNTNSLSLHDSIQGSPGNYRMGNAVITLSDAVINGRNVIAIQFSPVTDAVVLANYQNLSSVPGALNATELPDAADTSDPKIQFSAGGSGVRTMTIFY
jgi:prepilin-type N-terminal cleavage/methylation domain-containing protein